VPPEAERSVVKLAEISASTEQEVECCFGEQARQPAGVKEEEMEYCSESRCPNMIWTQ